jgi:hypothetical protein
MLLQESHEIFSLDEIELARLQGFGGQFVWLAGHGGVQAQNFTALRDPQNEASALARSSREFHPSAANDINAARGLAFHEQHRTLRVPAGILYALEFLERLPGEVTKEAGVAKLADKAVFRELKAVR